MAPSVSLLSVNPEHPSERHVDRAVELLEKGALICYPSDLNYAIGCDLLSKKSLEKLFQLKNRERAKPFAFVCADLSEVSHWARVNNFAHRTMRRLTPGPFTFVLEATRQVPDLMITRQKSVGVRIPQAPFVQAIVRKLGRPIVSSTASDDSDEPLVDPKEVRDRFGHGLELIFDAGIVEGSVSTVVSLLEDSVVVLREGEGEVEED